MVWPFLLIGAALAMLRRASLAAPFILCLMATVILNSAGIHYHHVYFLAIWGGIGALVFLVVDGLAGAVLCLIGLLYGLQVLGVLELTTRQVVGEIVFIAGLVAGGISGPTGLGAGGIFDNGRRLPIGSRLRGFVSQETGAPRPVRWRK